MDNDTDPIITEEDEQLAQQSSHRNKWAFLGGCLALTSSLVYTFYGLLIKHFSVDFVDTLFVRSVIQTVFITIWVKVRSKGVLLTFSEDVTKYASAKTYFVLIFQATLSGLNMMCTYLGVLYIPLGDALTIIYAGPIFTMIFSFLFLRIKQGLWKISFAMILMAGVILVVRPPFIFYNDDLCQTSHQNSSSNVLLKSINSLSNQLSQRTPNYWTGVGFSLSAACIGGLINVCVSYLKAIDNGTIMVWNGMLSIVCAILFLSFDRHSVLFFQPSSITMDLVGKWFALSMIGILGNWLATGAYQLLDPTICAVLRAQEVVFAFVVQWIFLHVTPCYITFIGASLVILSAVCSPLEKIVVKRLPSPLNLIC